MGKYQYFYTCPNCGTQLELKMRVTLTKRRCPQCGLNITPAEIDRQAAEAAARARREMLGCLIVIGVVACGVIAMSLGPSGDPTPSPQLPPPPSNVTPLPQESKSAKPEERQLVLTTKTPVIRGVVAWVEIDGVRVADWKVGSKEVRVTVAPGMRDVAVRSIFQGLRRTIFDRQVNVSDDPTTTVNVGP